MRKILLGFTIIALGAPQVVDIAAQEQSQYHRNREDVLEESKGMTLIRGQLVCRTCYLKNNANTNIEHEGVPEHDEGFPEECAVICSKKGMPLALLTRDGKLYTVTGKLAARSDVVTSDGDKRILRRNEPNGQLVTNLVHTIMLYGKVSEKNGELQIDAVRQEWLSDTKDWRVGSTRETRYSEGGKVIESKDDKEGK